MAHSFLIFNFGSNEETAQKARHRLEGWRQGFRLDKKLQLKIERSEAEKTTDPAAAEPSAKKSAAAGKKTAQSAEARTKAKAKTKAGSGEDAKAAGNENSSPAEPSQIRMIVRLDFSDHEKLSHQRWLDRIPGEEPFKDASPQVVRAGESEFDRTSALFDSLD